MTGNPLNGEVHFDVNRNEVHNMAMAQIRFTMKISNFIDFGPFFFPYRSNTIETNEKFEIANNQFPL